MPIVEPFGALRYDPMQVSDLSAVTAPPYDVIDPELHTRLLAVPNNIVHLDLNPGPLESPDGDNRYRRAAQLLGEWRDRGVLHRDGVPAIYLYEQEYRWGDETFRRRSFIARCRLEQPETGVYRQHERTFSAPKEDRFRLTVETRCNLSQVLGIHPDSDGEAAARLVLEADRAPDMEATDLAGDHHRVWIETDPGRIRAVCGPLADRPVYVADGHHRFQTALRYLDWLSNREFIGDDHPAWYTSFALVASAIPSLRVRPTHRVVGGLTGFDADALAELCADGFERTDTGVDPTDVEAIEQWVDQAPLNGVGVLTADRFYLLTPRSPEVTAQAMPGASESLCNLNVSVLHNVLLPTHVSTTWGAGETAYVHRAAEAVEGVRAGAEVAFLLRATPLETMFAIAGGGELLPQKSTYFYPKVLTGLVLYPLSR